MSDDSPAWPDDGQDPFAEPQEMVENHQEAQVEHLESLDVETQETSHVPEDTAINHDHWTLPVRVSPLLALAGEDVQEFPLCESTDGKKTTSLILSDKLLRIIEVTYDDDGQRRLNVKAVLKNELTGFSHNHNQLIQKNELAWLSTLFLGLAAMFFGSNLVFLSVFGLGCILIGLGGWVYTQLEVHSLEFSTSGSKHKIFFTGYGSNRARFRASMALLGPTIAKYMDTGDFDTDSITTLHGSLDIPVETKSVEATPPIVMIDEQNSQLLEQDEISADKQGIPTQDPPLPPQQESDAVAHPPVSNNELSPAATTPAPNQPNLQPLAPLPPPPLPKATSTVGTPLPPPLPPVLPRPISPTGMIPPPPGMISPPMPMDASELPLDAPLPDAPEIAVTAAPIEESLTMDEKNELLEELK